MGKYGRPHPGNRWATCFLFLHATYYFTQLLYNLPLTINDISLAIIPNGWICTIQFKFWPPQLYQHLQLHSLHFCITIYHSPLIKTLVLFTFTLTAFSALMLLVEHQEGHPAGKNWGMRCKCGYLSGAKCKWFAYGPTDATFLASVKSRMVMSFW